MISKILIATGLYPPDIGGPATYSKMLEEMLPNEGIEVVIVPFGSVRVLPKGIRHIVYFFRLIRYARESDAVYALDAVSVGLPALWASKIAKKPFLVRLGGDYAWEQGRLRFGVKETLDQFTLNTTPRPFFVRVLARIQAFVVSRAQCVIAPSEYLKNIIVTWGIEAGNVKVIHSALFPLPVSVSREELRKRLAYNSATLITASRLTPWKGVDALLAVVVRLQKEIPDASLIIAGEGKERVSLERRARKLGIESSVRFVGQLSKEALGSAIKGADVFVYNTSYEGLPHQLLEVMDLGVPIVTTNIPGNREILHDGIHALLVQPNDVPACTAAVQSVLKNKKLRENLVANARLRTKDFSKEAVVKEFANWCKQIL